MNETHRVLWPGFGIPKDLVPKHTKLKDFNEVEQKVWLRQNSIRTSVLFSLLVWALSSKRRTLGDRRKARNLMEELLMKLLLARNGLKLKLRRIGSPVWAEFHLPTTQLLAPGAVWPAALALKAQLRDAWDLARLQKEPRVATSFDSPGLMDFIFFSFDNAPSETWRMCQPLAQSLVAQICFAVDANVLSLGASKGLDAAAAFRTRAQYRTHRQSQAAEAAFSMWTGKDDGTKPKLKDDTWTQEYVAS